MDAGKTADESLATLPDLLARADGIAHHNRAWVAANGLMAPGMDRLLARLHELAPQRRVNA